jgi:hypothetical protein
MLFHQFLVALALVTSVLSQGWHSGESTNTIMGVSSGAQNTQMYAAGYSNTKGGILYYSGDRANHEPSVIFQVGGINMDVAVSNDKTTVAVVGPSGIFYGPTGLSFTSHQVSVPQFDSMVSQEVRPLGASGFAVIGRFSNSATESTVNGVAVATSANAAAWTLSDIGLSTASGYYARYGSFPTATTWYVTSGNWPPADKPGDEKLTSGIVERVSGRLSVMYNVGDNTPQITFMSAKNLLGTFPGAISKTTDGGATWTKVFDSAGKYYMNQIDCFDATHCFAVGEDMKSATVLQTIDGGAHWTAVMSLKGPKSLHSVRMISNSEVWVSGGEPSSGTYANKEWVGNYYHSTNGGATWATTSYNGYGFDMAWDNGIGYASAFFKKHTDVWTYQ